MITGSLQDAGSPLRQADQDRDERRVSGRRRRLLAAQAAASAGGMLSLTAVLLGSPALAGQAHAVRVRQL